MEKDRAERLANQERLRELARAAAAKLTVFCSRSVTELERLARVSPELPAEYLSALCRRLSYPSAEPAPSVVALPA
jgi:hypothetical protein